MLRLGLVRLHSALVSWLVLLVSVCLTDASATIDKTCTFDSYWDPITGHCRSCELVCGSQYGGQSSGECRKRCPSYLDNKVSVLILTVIDPLKNHTSSNSTEIVIGCVLGFIVIVSAILAIICIPKLIKSRRLRNGRIEDIEMEVQTQQNIDETHHRDNDSMDHQNTEPINRPSFQSDPTNQIEKLSVAVPAECDPSNKNYNKDFCPGINTPLYRYDSDWKLQCTSDIEVRLTHAEDQDLIPDPADKR